MNNNIFLSVYGRNASLKPQPIAPQSAITQIASIYSGTHPVDFTDTEVVPIWDALPVISNWYNFTSVGVGKMVDNDNPTIALNGSGRYLLLYNTTVKYAASCADARNLSDATIRMRMRIGGTAIEESSICRTLHSKLCATGLVREVTGGNIEGTTQMDSGSSGYGDTTGTVTEVTVEKVSAYNRWVGARETLFGAIEIFVDYVDGEYKIVLSSPSVVPASRTLLNNDIEIVVDRFQVETAAGVEPFTSWNSNPEITLEKAKLDIIKL